MTDYVKAAADAKTDPDFFLIARTDAIQVDGVDAAIERAIACGERRSSRLTGIHLPRERMDAVRDSFRQVPVEDCGAGVMRLVFES